ncbi:MAG: fyuA 9, partial [Caulobacter sp.]|nr:fyuA 9 [Caulobacter sp.]
MRLRIFLMTAGAALGAVGAAGGCRAETPDVASSRPPEVSAVTVTFGRAEQRIGKAVAASEGAIAGADLTIRPLLRAAEILEAVPGMMVTQHSGSGKANQYFLRGFNLDHGTDFAFSIDDVPM